MHITGTGVVIGYPARVVYCKRYFFELSSAIPKKIIQAKFAGNFLQCCGSGWIRMDTHSLSCPGSALGILIRIRIQEHGKCQKNLQ